MNSKIVRGDRHFKGDVSFQKEPTYKDGSGVEPDELGRGKKFYVSSDIGSDGGQPATKTTPRATLANALIDVVSGRGDRVILMQGHAETLTAALAIDEDAVEIISMGRGTQRATFTGTGTTDGFQCSGDGILLKNIIFKHTTANGTGMVDLSGTGNRVEGCRFEMGANALVGITVTDAADDTEIFGNEFFVTANGPDVAIDLEVVASTTAGASRIQIIGNHFDGGSSTNGWDEGAIETDAVCAGLVITDNTIVYGGAGSVGAIQLTAACTGILARNMLSAAALAQAVDPGSLVCFENYVANDTADETGIVIPATTPT